VSVKLLFDENLAPRLAGDVADLYPGSAHVRDFGLRSADDEAVWARAADGGFVIVTKDDDFRQRSFLRGHPPKVVWRRLGNCRTREVALLLRTRSVEVSAFAADPGVALLVLGRVR
jgi:predicted nuclease of predicted toxin-antitoxin system